jgi:excisionase family DNA binding protein
VADKWLLVSDVADELKISIDTVRNWINRKKNPLPAVKAGRDWRIKREDLDKFLEKSYNVREDDEEQ